MWLTQYSGVCNLVSLVHAFEAFSLSYQPNQNPESEEENSSKDKPKEIAIPPADLVLGSPKSPIDSSPEWQTGQWSKVSAPNQMNQEPQPYSQGEPGPSSFGGPAMPGIFQAPNQAPQAPSAPIPPTAPPPVNQGQRPKSGFGPLPPGAPGKPGSMRNSGTGQKAAPPPAPPPPPPPGSPFRSSSRLPGQAPPPPTRSSNSLPAQAPPLPSMGLGPAPGLTPGPAPGSASPPAFGGPPAPDMFQQAFGQAPPSPFANVTQQPAQPTQSPQPAQTPQPPQPFQAAPQQPAQEAHNEWVVKGSFEEEDRAQEIAILSQPNPQDPRKSMSGMPRVKSFSEKKRNPTQQNMPQLIFPKEAQAQFSQPSELPKQERTTATEPDSTIGHTPFEPPSQIPTSAPSMDSNWGNPQLQLRPEPAPPAALTPAPIAEPQEDILAQVEANYSAFAPTHPAMDELGPESQMESFDDNYPQAQEEEPYSPPASGFSSSAFTPETPEPAFQTSQPAPSGTGLRQARGQIIAAESAFENQNYDVAVPLFERILKLLREDHGQGEPEYVSSLQKLGDCYYYRGDYEKAMPLYLESSNLSSQRSNTAGPGAIVNLQKLSKTYEKLERPSDAELAGAEAIELANLTLSEGHPLMPVVYKSYIGLLESIGAPKVKIKTYERELQDRIKSSSPQNEDYESDLKAWTNHETFDLEPVKQQHQAQQVNKQRMQSNMARSRGEHKKPFQVPNLKPILFTTAAIVIVGGMAFAGITALLNTAPTVKKNMIDARMSPYVGKTFTSADGTKSLLVKEGIASIAFGENTQSYPCDVGNGAQDLMSTARKLAGAQQDYVFKQTNQGFEDPSGTILYAEDAEDHKILKAMDKIAELAGFSFSRKKTRYPVKRKDFNDLGPGIELYSPLEIKFSQFDEDEGTTRFNENLQDMKAGRPLFGPDGKPGIPPGLIECMSVVPFVDSANVKGIGFLIRAYDKNGKFIRGSNNEVRVIALKNGVEVPSIEKKDITSPIKPGSQVMIFLQLAK